jgi:hypothetical protein
MFASAKVLGADFATAHLFVRLGAELGSAA